MYRPLGTTHNNNNNNIVETSMCDLETGADETLYTFQSNEGSSSVAKKKLKSLIKSSNNDEEERMKYLDDDRVGYDDESTLTDDSSKLLLTPNIYNNNKQPTSYGGVDSGSNNQQQHITDGGSTITGVYTLKANNNLGGRRRFLHRRTLSNNTTSRTIRSNTATATTGVGGGNGGVNNSSTVAPQQHNVNNMQLVIHKNRKRRWQYMCLASSTMGFFISLLISITIVIFYVFRSPYVYIDQLSITKLPTTTTSNHPPTDNQPHAILGFNLNFIIYNMNIQDAQLTDICIEKISIKDIGEQTSYDLITNPLDWQYETNGTSLTLKAMREIPYTLPISIDFTQQALSPSVIKTISDLIFSSLQSNHFVKWTVKGNAKIRVGNLIYRVIDLSKDQQYFSFISTT